MESGMVAVNRWADASQTYFLTHLHSDHTRGLSSSWRRGPLFCSRDTAKLLPFKFTGFDVFLLRVMEIGVWYSLSLVWPSNGTITEVKAMAIDAHHCPGAVMFLFRGEFGHLLFTGDFRWEAAGDDRADARRKMLLNALDGAKLDLLYLDNTYCNPFYSFPSRKVATRQVIDIITSHPEHDIVIGIQSLGKEDLLVQISQALHVKIGVWPERLQTMHLLGLPDVFTTKTSLTRVRAIPLYSFSIDTLEGLNLTKPTLGVMPSGCNWMENPLKTNENSPRLSAYAPCNNQLKLPGTNDGNRVDRFLRSAERVHQYIYSVPYSDHCCYPEIKEFVRHLQPSKVKGMVSLSSCYVDPIYHLRHLLRSNKLSEKNLIQRTASDAVGSIATKRKDENGRGILKVISRITVLRRAVRRQGLKIVENGDTE